jgi:hypothetical protein
MHRFPPMTSLALALAAALWAGAVTAMTVQVPGAADAPRGPAVAQRFLPSGAALVTDEATTSCLVSRKIEISTSSYIDWDGRRVPFDQIVRSPATTIQAFATSAEAPAGFRIQLKYSPGADTPIWLTMGGTRVDVSGAMEPSTDSLHLDGDLARRLEAAFAAGETVTLAAVSGDTRRTVTDTLPEPGLAALTDCRAVLAAGEEDGGLPLPFVTLDFTARPSAQTRATPEDMQACAMTPTDLPVHLGQLNATTGVIAQTQKVFVAFDPSGRPMRIYVPGIFDAGLDLTGMGEARVSLAADSNVPEAENGIKGCLGAESMEICTYATDKDGGWAVRPCGMLPGAMAAVGRGLFDPLALPGLGPVGGLGGGGGDPAGRGFSAVPAELAGVFDPAGFDPLSLPDPFAGTVIQTRDPRTPRPPSPVPLPAGGLLLLSAAAALALLRRR